jgi:hemolysin III
MPDYTHGEEIFNMISHIIGGALGVVALVLSVVFSALFSNTWAVVSAAIYVSSIIILYTASSVYHGLHMSTGKRVMQVIDHCAIYLLIAGTYTPVALCSIREYSAVWGWGIFGAVWGFAFLGISFTAIDIRRYEKLSMIFYLGMGWCIIIAAEPALAAIPLSGISWIFAGGISYTIGAGIYNLGKKKRCAHSVFHIFVVLGSILQFFGIFFYVLL